MNGRNAKLRRRLHVVGVCRRCGTIYLEIKKGVKRNRGRNNG